MIVQNIKDIYELLNQANKFLLKFLIKEDYIQIFVSFYLRMKISDFVLYMIMLMMKLLLKKVYD